MFQCPADIRDRISRLDKSTDYADTRVWKADKKYKDAYNKLEYITLRLTQVYEDDPKFAMLSFRRNEAAAKTALLKDKLDEAKEEAIYFTRVKLQLMVAAYSDPANFRDGTPYLD
jgi:hypothetical protein